MNTVISQNSLNILEYTSCLFLTYSGTNGAFERRNRIIVEKGLTLLAQASPPMIFWEQAFHTSVYLSNRTITPILDHKSPYQTLYNKVPDYNFLKTFGCLFFPYLRPWNIHKLEFPSLPCIFLGYSSKHKGYCYYHAPTSRILLRMSSLMNINFCFTRTSNKLLSQIPNLHKFHSLLQLILYFLTLLCLVIPSPHPYLLNNLLILNLKPAIMSPPPHPYFQHNLLITHLKVVTLLLLIQYYHRLILLLLLSSQPSYFRPCTTSTHSMTTRARTISLKPEALVTTKASRPNSKSPFYEPRHYSHATKHDHWNKGIQAEYLALINNGTWSLVSPPPNTNIVGCKWVYRVKLKVDGSIERYKALLVAKGLIKKGR